MELNNYVISLHKFIFTSQLQVFYMVPSLFGYYYYQNYLKVYKKKINVGRNPSAS